DSSVTGVQTCALPISSLQVMYQIWAPAKDPRQNLGKKLDVRYALGRPAVPGSAKEIQEEVGMEQFDAGGSLTTGKKLSLDQANRSEERRVGKGWRSRW